MAEEYVSKIQAYSIVKAATGYGTRTIDRIFEQLVAEGRITLRRDFDGRTYRISRTEVDTLIRVLKREIE